AMAVYVLAPAGYDGGPIRFAVVFVCATLLGFASHAPGGIGVFDAAMLLGLPELDRAELVATLVVFRGLYYPMPPAGALGLLGVREIVLASRELRSRTQPQYRSGTIMSGDTGRRA